MRKVVLRAKELKLWCPNAPRLPLSEGAQTSLGPGLCAHWLGHSNDTDKIAKLFGDKCTYISLSAGWIR